MLRLRVKPNVDKDKDLKTISFHHKLNHSFKILKIVLALLVSYIF